MSEKTLTVRQARAYLALYGWELVGAKFHERERCYAFANQAQRLMFVVPATMYPEGIQELMRLESAFHNLSLSQWKTNDLVHVLSRYSTKRKDTNGNEEKEIPQAHYDAGADQ